MAQNTDKELQDFMKALGKNIKAAREKSNLTQSEMYQEPYKFERRYWQRIEAGEQNITVETIFNICKKLDVKPKDLFDFDIL